MKKIRIPKANKITFKLYDRAEHRAKPAKDAYIDGTGQIWYNNSRRRDMPIWEKLHESGEGCHIKDVIIEIDD